MRGNKSARLENANSFMHCNSSRRGTVSAVALGILIKFIHDYCGGAGHALYGIVVLLLYFWISDTERKLVGRSDIDINKIKTRLKDSSNNLSKKVRTKKKIFTEELPGLYYCQIGAFITIILWIIYGIYSLIHGLKSYIVIEVILAIITAVRNTIDGDWALRGDCLS